MARQGRDRTTLWLIGRLLLLACLAAFVVASIFLVRPVVNPGIQDCGSPAAFALRNEADTRIPPPGSPDEPPNAAALRAQPRCRLRVDRQLAVAGVAVALGVAFGLAGAAVGLIDDRLRYRHAPKFETFLRERPPGEPGEVWDLPVVPEEDLGRRLPDLEWREIRVLLAASVLGGAVLVLVAPWSDLRPLLPHVRVGWLVVLVALVGLGAVVAAVEVRGITEGMGEPSSLGGLTLTELASSYTGRLLPEYGAPGLVVHRSVRAGVVRRLAIDRVAALLVLAAGVHAALLVIVLAVVAIVQPTAGTALRYSPELVLFVVVMVVLGLATMRHRTRLVVVRPDSHTPVEIRGLSQDPVRLATIVGAALVLALVHAAVWLAAVRAFGASGSTAGVLAVGLGLEVLALVAPTPDGGGVIEVAGALGLVWAGVDAAPAVGAVLAARLLTFWLPMLPGWGALRRLRRDGAL